MKSLVQITYQGYPIRYGSYIITSKNILKRYRTLENIIIFLLKRGIENEQFISNSIINLIHKKLMDLHITTEAVILFNKIGIEHFFDIFLT